MFTERYLNIVKKMELAVRFAGIPKNLAISWFFVVDYRETGQLKFLSLPVTKSRVAVSFCNIKLIITNVQERWNLKNLEATAEELLRDAERERLESVKEEERADGMSVSSDEEKEELKKVDESDSEDGGDTGKKDTKKDDDDSSDEEEKKNPDKDSDDSSAKEGKHSMADEDDADTKCVKLNVDDVEKKGVVYDMDISYDPLGEDGKTTRVNTRYASYFPSRSRMTTSGQLVNALAVPVEEDEIVMFEGVADIYQSFVFVRFQLRAYVKLSVSSVLFFIPFLVKEFNAQHAPYIEAASLDSNQEGELLLASFSFLLTDLVEWITITKYFMLRQCRNPLGKLELWEQTMGHIPLFITVLIDL